MPSAHTQHICHVSMAVAVDPSATWRPRRPLSSMKECCHEMLIWIRAAFVLFTTCLRQKFQISLRNWVLIIWFSIGGRFGSVAQSRPAPASRPSAGSRNVATTFTRHPGWISKHVLISSRETWSVGLGPHPQNYSHSRIQSNIHQKSCLERSKRFRDNGGDWRLLSCY